MSVAVIEETRSTSGAAITADRTVDTSSIIVGSWIWVASYCPFHGLRSTVLQVYPPEYLPDEQAPDEPPDRVYQIQLDEGSSREPIEFRTYDGELLIPLTSLMEVNRT